MPSSIWESTSETDLLGWRLKVGEDNHGQHKWIFLHTEEQRNQWPQTKEDKYWLGLPLDAPDLPKAKTPLEAARNGLTFVKELQSSDGHFAAEYGGPLFLIPGLVIGLHVCGRSLRPEQAIEMKRYLLNRRRKEGGWGLHTAAPPTVYGTVMNYVALRLLGMGPDEGPMSEIRALIHKMGGATGIPTWGKVWLSVLGCYDWEGVNPVPPEINLMPDWIPFATSRWWVHVRAVARPLSFLYGLKWIGPISPIVLALRQEIYPEPYESIKWSYQRNNVNPIDVYCPHSKVMDILHLFLGVYEKIPGIPFISFYLPIRKAGLNRTYDLIRYEDENTGYQTIGPVSKMFNLVCRYIVEGPDSEAFKNHLIKVENFLWMGKDGLMMCGTDGSQLWDLAFLAQALSETGLAEEEGNEEMIKRMLDWLDKAQMRENCPWMEESRRHRTKGAWPFSTPEQGYVVSDCAAEGLKAAIAMQALPFTPKPITLDRMRDCVDTLLSMQNPNGGYASYELQRGSEMMELLNAAEVFGNIMVDYMYPECTTSALSALKYFQKLDQSYRSSEINQTINKAIQWIHTAQRPDGSWYGSWGVCFTYATMFALESLGIAGESYDNSERVRRACEFLVGKQMDDGGWGETYMSCVTMEYCQHEQSQVVMTSWAILALLYAKYPNKQVIEKACKLVMSRQQKDGRWLQEDTEGIFNKNCAIDYPFFKFVFCIWALGRADKYLRQK